MTIFNLLKLIISRIKIILSIFHSKSGKFMSSNFFQILQIIFYNHNCVHIRRHNNIIIIIIIIVYNDITVLLTITIR